MSLFLFFRCLSILFFNIFSQFFRFFILFLSHFLKFFLSYPLNPLKIFPSRLKGTVNVISSVPPFIEWHVGFTTAPWKSLFIKKKGYFQLWLLFKSIMHIFTTLKIEEIVRNKTFKLEKRWYLPYFWSDKQLFIYQTLLNSCLTYCSHSALNRLFGKCKNCYFKSFKFSVGLGTFHPFQANFLF